MRTLALASLCFAASLLLPACGGNVETPGGSGGSGGAGTTTSGTSSTTSATGGGGGSGPVACGGLGGAMCGADEFCDWADDSCGADDGQGICQPRPQGCTADCPGVCGCDGQTYCNACVAAAAGVDVAANVPCATSAGEYSAYFWAGGLDHLMIFKADQQADRCTMLYLAWPIMSPPEFAVVLPNGWGVQSAEITNSAADCADPMSPPVGEIFNATAGAGSASWQVAAGMYAPCDVDVDLTLDFAGAPAWAPASDALVATAVPVQGGCM